MKDTQTRYVISVLASDRVGIVKHITSAITDRGGDIYGMSQTVVQGYFTVILAAQFETPLSADDIRDAILAKFDTGETSVVVRPIEAHDAVVQPKAEGTERYILTLSGKDRPGILKTVTAYLADNNINIEDYYFTITGERVTHIGEITIPPETDIKQLQGELESLLFSFQLVATLQHENLFRATNDVFSIRELFRTDSCEE